jgi:lipid-A-disaccharide synthase
LNQASLAQETSAEGNPSLLVVAGDLSADKHVGKLLLQLKQAAPELNVWGMGSTIMQKAGAELLFDCKEYSSMGIVGVVKLKPFLDRVARTLLNEIEKRKPNVVLLVDYGGFNLAFSKSIKKRFPNLKILYFISPQVWGSRPWRIKTIAKTISKMLVIFPFEETLYRSHGIPVRFVGHPLCHKENPKDPSQIRKDFFLRYGLDGKKSLIAIFPGSRKSEIPSLFPVVWQAMHWLAGERDDVQFAISLANPERAESIQKIIDRDKKHTVAAPFLMVPAEENDNLMDASDVIWAKSGTTALEATIHGKPMLVYYRADWLSYWIFLLFKRVRKISLPNLLSGKTLVPELIQLDCRADQLVKYTRDLLDVPQLRSEITNELLALKSQLGEGDFAAALSEEILEAIRTTDQLVKY